MTELTFIGGGRGGERSQVAGRDAFLPERIEQLRKLLGAPRLDALLGLVASECRERPELVRRGQERGDLAAVHAEARSLLGAATSIGAGAIGEATLRLQSAPDLERAGPLIDALDVAARETLDAARALLAAGARVTAAFEGKRLFPTGKPRSPRYNEGQQRM